MAAPPGGLPLWGRVLALPLPPSSLCCRPVTAPRAPPARAGCLCCPSIPRAALPPSHFSCPWRLLCFPGVFPMPCYSLATKPELRRCSRLQNAVCASLSGDHRHPEAPGCFPCSSGTPTYVDCSFPQHLATCLHAMLKDKFPGAVLCKILF